MISFKTPIIVKNLVVKYGDYIAVNNVSFRINRGLTYLLGPNGSGKTSIIKALTGIIRPYKGKVLVLGCDPTDMGCLDDRVHVAFEETMLPGHLSIRDYLENIAYMRGYKGSINQIYELLCLEKHLDKKISELSKGLKRRVTLTTLFIGTPDIIIIDEPYNGLDIRASIMLNSLLTNYLQEHPNTAVLISTHIIPPLKPDKVILLSNGKVIYDGAPPEERIKIRARQGESSLTMTIEQLNDLFRSMGVDLYILGIDKESIYNFVEEKLFGVNPSGSVPS